MATAKFNQLRMARSTWEGSDIGGSLDQGDIENFKLAMFDARVFQIPYHEEVVNYFIWRQQDATRNSISSVAQSMYSPKELHGKKTDEMQEMIFQKGINWNDYSPREKRGSIIRKFLTKNIDTGVIRPKWGTDENTPIFSQDRDYLKSMFIKE